MTVEVEGTAEMGRAQRKQELILLCDRPVSAVPLLRFWGHTELLRHRGISDVLATPCPATSRFPLEVAPDLPQSRSFSAHSCQWAAVPFGRLEVALLDHGGRAIQGAEAVVSGQDALDIHLPIPGSPEKSGHAARIQFTLHNGRLFSFWIDKELYGASEGPLLESARVE